MGDSDSKREEIVIRLTQTPKPGWPCPRCGGRGDMLDGSCSIGPDEYRFTPATKCHLCEGSGRVNCTPAPT